MFYSVLCFSHDVITPPPPPRPPFCKRQRNFQRNTIFQPSNIFQDSTSSNALHMTLLHPPSVYKNDLSGIASRLRVPRSSGEPPALSLYLYTHIIIYIHTYVYIYIYVYRIHIWGFCQRCGESVCVLEILKQSKTPL